MLAEAQTHQIDLQRIEQAEAQLLALPQVECPIAHHFGPGLYIREITFPPGVFVIGHEHIDDHMNIMLKGALLLLGDDGKAKELRAPTLFVGKPGRKVAYVLEETVWQNIYATEERDLEKLEKLLVKKSPSWCLHNQKEQLMQIDGVEK